MIKNSNFIKVSLFITISIAFFVSAGASKVFADGVNLMPNPTFAPDPSNIAIPLGWKFSTYGTNTAISEYPSVGPNASTTGLKTIITSYTSGFSDWFSSLVPVTAFAEYNYSDSYLSNTTGVIEAQYTIKDIETGAITNLYTDLAYTSPTNGSWATSSVTFVAPAGATSVMIFHLINSVGSLTIANPALIKTADPTTFPQGMVSITFDDGNQTNYDKVFPVLKTAGLTGTFYIISQSMTDAATIGTSTGDINDDYMNANEVMEINRAGNEIGNHTVNHCNLITGLCPDAEVLNSPDPLTAMEEINQASTTLHQIGALPLDTFSYPYGAYNQTIENDLQSAGLISGRSVDRGYNLTTSNRYALKIQYVTSSSTTAADFQTTIKPWIDTAIQNHVWLILLFHQIEPASVIAANKDPDATTPEVLQAVVDYLKQNNVSVVTVHTGVCQMLGMASNPRCSAPTVPGPATTTPPTTNTPPTITLLGANPLNLTVNTPFVDPGATATDTEDGNLTAKIVETGSVDASTTGSYTLTYSVTDSGGLSASTTREVVVEPVCTSNCGGGGGTPNADLTVTKTVDKSTANVGDTLTYTISLINNGPDNAPATNIIDLLPSGLSFVSATSTTGSYSTTTGVWTIGNLTDNASSTLIIITTVNTGTEGQKITNTAVASSTEPDSNLANNSSSVDININTTGGGGSGGGGGGTTGGGSSGGGGGTPSGHRQSISSSSIPQGEILGATSCFYLRDYLKIDWKNDPIEVLKLQSFLNVYEKEHLLLTAKYDQATFDAVSRFQTKYASDILAPWGPRVTKGFTYILTKKKVNEIYCNSLFPVNQAQQNEIDAFKAIGENNSNGLTTNRTVSSLPSRSSISNVLNNGAIQNSIAVELKSSSTNQSVVRNVAISLFALPHKIFSSSKSFIIFLILIAIIIVIIRLLADSQNNPTVPAKIPIVPVVKTDNKKVPPTKKESPVIILPGVLPDEEIIIENPEEGPEEVLVTTPDLRDE